MPEPAATCPQAPGMIAAGEYAVRAEHAGGRLILDISRGGQPVTTLILCGNGALASQAWGIRARDIAFRELGKPPAMTDQPARPRPWPPHGPHPACPRRPIIRLRPCASMASSASHAIASRPLMP